jgi:uncharacterized membrane protein
MIKNWRLSLAVCSALALGLCAVRADEDLDVSKLPPAASQSGVTYATDIKPILDKSCIKCHSGEKPKGKLNLTTLDGVLKGGKDGIVVVAGDVSKSPLVFAVAHVGDPDDFMPPPKNKANIGPLTKDQVALIRAWVEQGAK